MHESFWDCIRKEARRFLGLVPPRPGGLTLAKTEQLVMLRYTVNLPPAPNIDDLATREAHISVDGTETIQTLAPDATFFAFDVDRNKSVSLTLVDVDTSGNKSDPSEALAFTSTDTVPPPVPGGMSVAKVEQV